MNNAPVVIAVFSAIAATVSALSSRRSSRIALMANGPGVEISAGVYQRADDTIGWVVLTNVGGSEARDIYLELYADVRRRAFGLTFDRELPLIIWHQPFLRRGSSAQISMPMMVFRELGLEEGFEIEPFEHFWVSYKDRLGQGHGFYAAVDYLGDPIDKSTLVDERGGQPDDVKGPLQISAPPTFSPSTVKRWKYARLMIPLVRRLRPHSVQLPSPTKKAYRLLRTKQHRAYGARSIDADFPECSPEVWPAFAIYSEDTPGKFLWHGNDPAVAAKIKRLLRGISGSIGDVEILEFTAGGVEVSRMRSRVSYHVLCQMIAQIDQASP